MQVVNKLWVLFSCFVFCFSAVKAISDDSYPWPITLTVTHLQKLFQFILEGNVFTLSSSVMIFLFFSTFSLLAISAQGSFKLFLSWSFWPFCLPCHCQQIASLKTRRRGLPWWRSGWESACQCRGHGFEPWSGRIPHAAERLGPWATVTEPARL